VSDGPLSVTLLIAQSSKQISVLLFDSGELTVNAAQRHLRNRIVPAEFFKLFSDVGFFQKLRPMPRIHLIYSVSKFGVIKISDFGFCQKALSGLGESFAGIGTESRGNGREPGFGVTAGELGVGVAVETGFGISVTWGKNLSSPGLIKTISFSSW
jgi:hypothetical protein